MRGKLGSLGNNGGIDVAETIPLGIRQPHDVAEQFEAIGPLVAGIGVGKMPSDVPLPNGAKDGVGDCMEQHICIRWPKAFSRDVELRSVSSFHQAMYVVAVGDAHAFSRIRLVDLPSESSSCRGAADGLLEAVHKECLSKYEILRGGLDVR
jgi:hypothetical protein